MRDRRGLGRLGLALGLAVALGGCSGGPGPPTPSASSIAPASAMNGANPSATAAAIPTREPTASPPPSPSPTPALPLALASSAFANGAAIPARYTCSGADGSPPLAWSHPPAGTAAFALVVVDTDANGFVHWVLSDIPTNRAGLAAGASAGVRGRNGFGGVGYGGPCPPVGSRSHHYVFTLYALAHTLGLRGVPTAAQVRTAAAKVTLAAARLTATFRR